MQFPSYRPAQIVDKRSRVSAMLSGAICTSWSAGQNGPEDQNDTVRPQVRLVDARSMVEDWLLVGSRRAADDRISIDVQRWRNCRLITTPTLDSIVGKALPTRVEPAVSYTNIDACLTITGRCSLRASNEFGPVPNNDVQPMFNTTYSQTTNFRFIRETSECFFIIPNLFVIEWICSSADSPGAHQHCQ